MTTQRASASAPTLQPPWPTDAASHRELAQACRASSDPLGELAHRIAVESLQASAEGRTPEEPRALLNVATGYFMKGDDASAERWYRLALHLDPGLAEAHLNLAAIHASRGDQSGADAHRDRAYRIQRVFEEAIAAPARRLLLLCAGRGPANVPFETLLAGGRSHRIKYAIDCANEEEDAGLPAFDLVFNAVGDADIGPALDARLTRFAAACARPLMNRPQAVQATRRDRLATLLGPLDNLVLAACRRDETTPDSDAALQGRLDAASIDGPVLLRPIGSHGGAGLVRCEDLRSLADALAKIGGPHYLTRFIDYRSADGFFRKYRLVYIGGRAWPYHLAISPHWMVHYVSADMPSHAWKLEEERAFLTDWRGVLGPRAAAAVDAIGHRLDLDYAGVDLGLLPGGQVLVFEANATMLVHGERPLGPLAYRNAAVRDIAEAFERWQQRRLQAS